MKILKLHGHKNNTGGIVNLQNGLQPHCTKSTINYLHFRTGKKQGSKLLSNNIVRIFDQLISYLYYPLFLWINKPDVIEINSSLVPRAFKRDYVYAKLTKTFLPEAKLVLFNHGWDYDFKATILKKNKSKLVKYFNFYDDIIVLANAFKMEIINELGIKTKNIYSMTTGINLLDYTNHKIIPNSSTELNVLFLSRIEKTKGISELINAIPLVLEKYPNTHFNIVGSGSFLSDLKSNSTFFKYQTNISLHGYLRGNKKLEILKESNIYIFPSHKEGCPVSVLEALAVGLPIIYTAVGALPDILENRKNGLLIEKKSALELSDAMNELIGNQVLRDEIGANNLELSKQFDLGIIHKQLETIYTE